MVKKGAVKKHSAGHVAHETHAKPHHETHRPVHHMVHHTPAKPAEKPVEHNEHTVRSNQREDLLVQNFVGLQHAMTNLSIKFGQLSDNLGALLAVFEEAAKTFTTSSGSPQSMTNTRELTEKVNILIEQNKMIARGLVMVEDKLQERPEPAMSMQRQPMMNMGQQAPQGFGRPVPSMQQPMGSGQQMPPQGFRPKPLPTTP